MPAHAPLHTTGPSAQPLAQQPWSACLRVLVCSVGAGWLLGGCSSLNSATNTVANVISPYRMEVVQGNFVSKEQVEALKPGMTRGQVRDILGTSLLVSIFHSDRWDYVFTLHRQGLENQSRRLSVFFKGDVLDHFEGDTMPSEAEFVATLESGRKLGKVPNLQADPEGLKKFAPTTPVAERPAPQQALPDSYPPLENPTR